MNFNLILNLVSTLSFSLKFGNNMEMHQDYFIFEGDNTSAHMFRDTCTLYLYLRQGLEYSIYHLNVSDSFVFTWDGYLINGTNMKQNDIGDISELIFENFTFVSPLLEVDTNRDMTPELIKRKNSSRDIKYWHILLIVIGLCIFLELKILLWIFSYNATSNQTVEVDDENVCMDQTSFST